MFAVKIWIIFVGIKALNFCIFSTTSSCFTSTLGTKIIKKTNFYRGLYHLMRWNSSWHRVFTEFDGWTSRSWSSSIFKFSFMLGWRSLIWFFFWFNSYTFQLFKNVATCIFFTLKISINYNYAILLIFLSFFIRKNLYLSASGISSYASYCGSV